MYLYSVYVPSGCLICPINQLDASQLIHQAPYSIVKERMKVATQHERCVGLCTLACTLKPSMQE